jgi:putative toxin-antitoxin system antitoxin component (TIGR02293 family)
MFSMLATQAHAPAPAIDLARKFSAWLADSTPPEASDVGRHIFVEQDATPFVDSARASRLIRTGVRAGHVAELVGLFGLSRKEDLSGALNTNGVSLWRWARGDKQLPGATVEQILRTMQLQLFAVEVFGDVDQAHKWLHKPHPSLDEMTPAEFANNEFGAQKVRGMLAGLKYGGVA